MSSQPPDYAALIAECREEQRKLMQSVELMERRVLGVGLPITIPDKINEATKQMIADLKAGIAEWEEAIREFEKASHA